MIINNILFDGCRQHGKGKYILPDNSVKIGLWEDGKRMKWLENETG